MSDTTRRRRLTPGAIAGGQITIPQPAPDASIAEYAEFCRAVGELTGAFHVFPCGPDGSVGRRGNAGGGAKEPHQRLTGKDERSWQRLATSDAAQVAEWWRADPHANIGLAIREGFGALDFDYHKLQQMPDALAAVEAVRAQVPPTLSIRSARGGEHTICLVDRKLGNSDGDLPDGIDVRGSGSGYLVGPGSYFEGKRYAFTDVRLPVAMPAAISNRLKTAKVRDAKSEEWLIEPDLERHITAAIDWIQSDRCGAAILGKGGDKKTYDTACMMRSFGLSEAVAHDLLLTTYNAKCSPEWTDEELWSKVTNAYAYSTSAPGNITEAYRTAKARALLNVVRAAPTDGSPIKLRAGLYNGMEFADRPPTEWIIEGWLEQSSYSIASARSQAGKTFNELALALAIATGRDWHGKPVAIPGPVLYIASEGYSRLQLDVVAWCQFHGLDPAPTLKDKFFSFDGVARLNTPEGMEELGALLADIKLAAGRDPVYAVFDTLRRNMKGGVSQEEPTSEVLHAIGELQRRRVAVTLVAHHGRGHSETKGLTEWEDDADQVRHYSGAVRDNNTVLEFSKIKRGEDGLKLKIKYNKVALPSGETTLVATADGAGAFSEDEAQPRVKVEFPDYNLFAKSYLDTHIGLDIPVADLCNLTIDGMNPDMAGKPAQRRPYYKSYYKHLHSIGTDHLLSPHVAMRNHKQEPTAFRNPNQSGRRLTRRGGANIHPGNTTRN